MPRCSFCQHENAIGTERCASCGAALTNVDVSRAHDRENSEAADAQAQSPTLNREIRELLTAGHKLQAISLYRERTGASLSEAKNAVEALERQIALPSRDLAGQLEECIRREGKIGAIKLYRQHTGRGLKESKDAVEAFARERNIAFKQVGCGATVLILLVLGAALGAWGASRLTDTRLPMH